MIGVLGFDSPLHSAQTGNKVAAADVYHPSPPSDKVKNAWGYTSTPPYVFAAQWLIEHRDDFTSQLFVQG
jgi:hypothetical protein